MNLALYLHIPFCESKCAYCDFFSVPRKGKCWDFQKEYDLIRAQAEIQLQSSPAGTIFSRYIGGGTPSCIGMEHLTGYFDLLEELFPREQFGTPVEYTIEANPRDITPEFLSFVESGGVNRLSMGIQSISDRDLSYLGRKSSSRIILEALEVVKQHWTGRLSLDIMAGIPGQEMGDVEALIHMATEVGAGHLSIYQLTVEEETPLAHSIARGEKSAPGEEEYYRLFKQSAAAAEEAGYHRYEVSSFARPGEESLHNLSYWKQNSCIGLGRGGVGTIYQPEKPFREALRFSTRPDGTMEKELLGEEELLTEYLMTRFRLTGAFAGTDLSLPDQAFPDQAGLEQKLSPVLQQYLSRGLLNTRPSETGKTLYFLTEEGLDILDRYLADLVSTL